MAKTCTIFLGDFFFHIICPSSGSDESSFINLLFRFFVFFFISSVERFNEWAKKEIYIFVVDGFLIWACTVSFIILMNKQFQFEFGRMAHKTLERGSSPQCFYYVNLVFFFQTLWRQYRSWIKTIPETLTKITSFIERMRIFKSRSGRTKVTSLFWKIFFKTSVAGFGHRKKKANVLEHT